MVFNSITPSAAARLSNERNRQSNYLNTILGTPSDSIKGRKQSKNIKERLNILKRNQYATEDLRRSVDTDRSQSRVSRMSSVEIIEQPIPEK